MYGDIFYIYIYLRHVWAWKDWVDELLKKFRPLVIFPLFSKL